MFVINVQCPCITSNCLLLVRVTFVCMVVLFFSVSRCLPVIMLDASLQDVYLLANRFTDYIRHEQKF